MLGVNLDDLGDHRPGQRAAAERGAAFPLVDAGFTKADVRAWSKELGLETWDKPAAACLASRLPYGTPVTLGRLASVERAEEGLRALGFAELRVRHHGEIARIEVPVADLERVVRNARRSSRRSWRPGTAGPRSTSPASAPAASTHGLTQSSGSSSASHGSRWGT